MFDPERLKDWLRHWQFWILECQFVILAALIILNAVGIAKFLRAATTALAWLIGISLGMFVLVTTVAPRTNRIYFDEHIYEATAQNMSDLHMAQMCNDGAINYGTLSCARGEYNKEPNGYPYLISIAYRIASVSETAAHAVNVLCAVLLVPVVFAVALALLRDERAALAAAFVLLLLPQQLWWSHTAAAEPSAELLAAFAVLTTIYHASVNSWRSLLLMTSAVVTAVQFRMEVALVVPLAIVVMGVVNWRVLLDQKTLAIAPIGLTLGASHLVHLLAVRGESWGAAGPRISVAHFWPNLSVNGWFYLSDPRFPAVVTVLALIGASWRPIRNTLIPVIAFALFWGIFLFFYAGSFNFGADVRFSLMANVWIAILAGAGVAKVAAWLDARTGNDRHVMITLVALLLVQFTWYLPSIRSVGDEAWAARADVSFAHAAIPQLPANSVVLTQTPSMFLVNGVSAAQMSLVTTDPSVVERLTREFAGGVYLHWGAWCGYIDPDQRRLCENTLNGFDSRLVAEYRERDFRYALYKLATAGTIRKMSEQ